MKRLYGFPHGNSVLAWNKVCHHNPISFAGIKKKKSNAYLFREEKFLLLDPSYPYGLLDASTASLPEIQQAPIKATRDGSHIEYQPQPILVTGGSIDKLRDLKQEVSAAASSAEMLHGTKKLLKSVFVVWLDGVNHHSCVRLGRHEYFIMKRKMVEGKCQRIHTFDIR